MKEFISKHKVALIFLIFLIFFLLVFIQHQFIWLYHDDYGYASLSYLSGFKSGASGYHTSISQIIDFLVYHYNNWGGRILYFFVECFLLSFGMFPFRLVQSLVITGIFYMIYKIITETTNFKDWKVALLSVCSYGIFEVMLLRGGIFWATASVLYLFPLLPFFVFIYLYIIKKKQSLLFVILNAILVFISAFSQEQISVMVVSFIFLYSLYEYLKSKKIDWNNIILFISSLIGFGILMLAPGSKVRIDGSAYFYDLSLIGKVKKALPDIILINFSYYTRIFTVLFCIVAVYIAYRCIKDKYGIMLLNKISLVSSIIVLTITLFKEWGYFNYIYNLSENDIFCFITMSSFIIQLLLMFYNIFIYLYEKNKILSVLFISGVLSQLSMLAAPYFPLRSAIMFEVVMFIIFIYVFVDIYNSLKKKKIINYIMLPFILIVGINFITVTKGYYLNNSINSKNDKILKQASKDIKKGKDIKIIKLKKLRDDTYSCDQPYMEGFDYIATYMKSYYDIPQEVNIVYE